MKKKAKGISSSHKRSVSYEAFPILTQGISSESIEMTNILAMMEKLLHWAAIVESSDDAIISKSLEGIITSWNKGAERLYGYKPSEIIGKPVSVLIPPEKEDDFPYIMKQLKEGKTVEHYETKRKTKDGKIIDVSLTVSPIKDSHGTVIGASKIARDITERIENEKRRDEFINTTSHELKTPITSQKVYGDLLEQLIDKNEDTQYKPYIRKINLQTVKLEKLITDLLELSRLQLDRLKMERKRFSIDLLVDEISEDMQKITKHTIIRKGKTDKKILGDRDRIGQVLINLLTNAIKYSPGLKKIIVATKSKGDAVIISVQDFGIGIDKEFHKKIFERFFRVTGDDEKTYPGMGIGLDFSLEVVMRHGGKMWVESTKGIGSTFYVSIPLNHKLKSEK